MNNETIFHEVYGNYYNAVAKILKLAVRGELTPRRLMQTVRSMAFAESIQHLPEALMSEKWPFLTEDMKTVLKHEPSMPLTTIEKRWLKSCLLDPRIRLFMEEPSIEGLEDVQPLFTPETIVYFDRYGDGDDFEDPDYIRNFRTILSAIRDFQAMEMTYANRHGEEKEFRFQPLFLEYSPRDDKFRLHADPLEEVPWSDPFIFNLSRIRACRILAYDGAAVGTTPQKDTVVLGLRDAHSALERVMLHFSWLEKRTERIADAANSGAANSGAANGGAAEYRITLYYDKSDETEILIRILSFGPDLWVIAPEAFREKVAERIRKQAT